MFLQKIKQKIQTPIPKTEGIFSAAFSKGNMKRTAQPKKFNIPNQITSVGIKTNVIKDRANPSRLRHNPLRRLPVLPHCHTKPDIKINVWHMDCCHI